MQRSTLRTVASVQFPSTFYEQVTFLSRNSGNQSTFTTYILARVRRKEIDDQEQLKRGLLGISRLAFVVGQDQLDNAQSGPTGTNYIQGTTAAPAPKARDQFIDSAGVVYTIPDKGVNRPLISNVHDCALLINPG